MNVMPFRPPMQAECEEITSRNKFSFDITQPDARGLVLFDACVPLSLAVEFMKLIAAHAGI